MQETDTGLIPGSGRSLGGGHSKPLQYFFLENPMDGGVWWAMVKQSQRVRHNWSDEEIYCGNWHIDFKVLEV